MRIAGSLSQPAYQPIPASFSNWDKCMTSSSTHSRRPMVEFVWQLAPVQRPSSITYFRVANGLSSNRFWRLQVPKPQVTGSNPVGGSFFKPRKRSGIAIVFGVCCFCRALDHAPAKSPNVTANDPACPNLARLGASCGASWESVPPVVPVARSGSGASCRVMVSESISSASTAP